MQRSIRAAAKLRRRWQFETNRCAFLLHQCVRISSDFSHLTWSNKAKETCSKRHRIDSLIHALGRQWSCLAANCQIHNTSMLWRLCWRKRWALLWWDSCLFVRHNRLFVYRELFEMSIVQSKKTQSVSADVRVCWQVPQAGWSGSAHRYDLMGRI